MAKRFFETFPALILEDELKDLFEPDGDSCLSALSPSDFKAADLCGGI